MTRSWAILVRCTFGGIGCNFPVQRYKISKAVEEKGGERKRKRSNTSVGGVKTSQSLKRETRKSVTFICKLDTRDAATN